MFTGIITSLGTLSERHTLGIDVRLRLTPHIKGPFTALERGESIAVNGVCLSVETFTKDDFWAYASAETLAHSNLSALALNAQVNLERALRVGDRLGGHLVTGHVDCVATITSSTVKGQSKEFTIHFPREYACELVPKGSVTLDGISLTINGCGPDWLSVNIIPETQENTTARFWTNGRVLNLETDILGKYVHRNCTLASQPQSALSVDFLKRHGYYF